ncbi:MAG TPA: hypothetical protein VK806_05520 [Bacteroidia bacterium]|jgi:hypothetical protein|nr:hypothetical protein [Bacteroidia bacterium]
MPVIGALVVMANDPFIYNNLDSYYAWFIVLGLIFLVTSILPIFISWLLVKLGQVSSLTNPTEQDRKQLILFTELFFLLAYYIFHNIPIVGKSLSLYLLGINAAMVLALIISLFTRISLHALGAGGILGTVIGLIYYTRFEMTPWVCGAMFLALLVGYSRYKLKAHEPGDIYIGYSIGVVAQSLVFFIGGR